MNFSELQETLQNLTNSKITKKSVAQCIGIDLPGYIRREKDHTVLTMEQLKKVSNAFEVDIDAINCGKKDNAEFVQIPVYGEVTASCGYGAVIDRETQTNVYPIPKAIIKGVGADEKTCDIVFASGNSMEPTILQGDALMVDRSKKEIIDGQIYVIRYDNELMCKRLQKLPPKRIKVVSDNEKYSSYEIDISEPIIDFEVIGRVMWYSRIAR